MLASDQPSRSRRHALLGRGLHPDEHRASSADRHERQTRRASQESRQQRRRVLDRPTGQDQLSESSARSAVGPKGLHLQLREPAPFRRLGANTPDSIPSCAEGLRTGLALCVVLPKVLPVRSISSGQKASVRAVVEPELDDEATQTNFWFILDNSASFDHCAGVITSMRLPKPSRAWNRMYPSKVSRSVHDTS